MGNYNSVKKANFFFLLTMLYIFIAPYILRIIFTAFPFLTNVNLVVLLIFSTLLATFVPVIFYFYITNERISDVIKIKKVSIKNLVLIFFICIFIQPFMSFLALVGMLFSENIVDEIASQLTSYPFMFSLMAIAVSPAIFEELLMRGVVLKGYEGISLKKMAIINGLFFGVMHTNIQQFFYAAALGFVFVYFVKLTGSILSSIFAHFVINGSQICLSYLFKDVAVENTNTGVVPSDFLAVGILAIPFTILAFYLFKKFIKNNKETYELLENSSEEPSKYKVFDIYFVLIFAIFLADTLINLF